jgi:hypothetical protein
VNETRPDLAGSHVGDILGDVGNTGARMFWLLLRPEAWIHRRVESVSFTDIGVARRRVSVDFTYPARFPGDEEDEPTATSLSLVPLTLLRKRRLVNFDLRREDGASIPHFTAKENGAIASATLAALGRAILGESVPDDIAQLLKTVASSSPPAANHAFRALRESQSPHALRLLSEDRFLVLLQELTWNFIVLIPLDGASGRRRVIKFAYDESALLPTVPHSLGWQLGLQPIPFLFRTPAAGDGASYHFEIEAPDELKINDAQLSLRGPQGEAWTDRTEGLKRAHLYSSHSVRGAQGVGRVDIRLRRAGLLRGSLLVTAFVVVILLIARLNLGAAEQRPEAVAAMLAILPPVVATYVARPREHALVTEMLVGLRLLVLGAGACSFALGVALVLGAQGALLCTVSTLLAAAAVAVWIMVFIAWHRARPDRQGPPS